MKHRWTDDDLQQVKENRVRGNSSAVEALRNPADSARKSTPKPPYKSKLELAFALRLEVMRREGEIDGWLYEPFTFKLAEGKRYRVDFISWKFTQVESFDGSRAIYQLTTAYECKGWHRNFRDAMTHLKWAAQRFPFFEWKKVTRNSKTGFNVMDVVV